MGAETYIEDFLAHLTAEQRCSEHTIEAYERDIRQFVAFCASDETAFDFARVGTPDIRDWVGSLAESGMTAATLRRKVESLRSFYHWARKTDRLTKNPAADVILPKLKKHLPNFIKEKDIEARLATDSESCGFSEQRANIALELLYSLGLRQAELLALTDTDVNLHTGEIRVTGKRNKTRILPLPPALCRRIEEWRKVRDERYPDLPYPTPLVAGTHGRLSKVTLYRIVKEALAGIATGRKSPHTLRHTFATAMINGGADLDSVRELLGHESLATTQIYTHLSIKDLMENYKTAHPRNKEGS